MYAALVWLASFVWTLALELPVYAALLKDRLRGPTQAFVVVLGLNLLTHPALSMVDLHSLESLFAAEALGW